MARLLRPVWQLNIVAIDADGNLISNAEYFKFCRAKVNNLHEILIEKRNIFIGSTVSRADGDKVDILEEKFMSEIFGFMDRLTAVLDLIDLLNQKVVGKVKIPQSEY